MVILYIMNKYFYILLILTIMFSYLFHVENFINRIQNMVPDIDTSSCVIHPKYMLRDHMDKYIKSYVKKKEKKNLKDEKKMLNNLEKHPYEKLMNKIKPNSKLTNVDFVDDCLIHRNYKPLLEKKRILTPHMNRMEENGYVKKQFSKI